MNHKPFWRKILFCINGSPAQPSRRAEATGYQLLGGRRKAEKLCLPACLSTVEQARVMEELWMACAGATRLPQMSKSQGSQTAGCDGQVNHTQEAGGILICHKAGLTEWDFIAHGSNSSVMDWLAPQ